MGINVKAVERKIAYLSKEKDVYMYVMQPMFYNKLTPEKVIQEAAIRGGLTTAVMKVAYSALSEVLKAWATEGHSVAIPGLGTMRFGLRADAVKSVDEVSSKLITLRRVIFTPSVEIKQELANTSISITCYDRNGKIVKNVSSKDSNDVEDTEGDGKENGGTPGGTTGGSTGDHAGGTTGDTTSGTPGGNTGESTGGGSQTGGTGSEDGNEHIVL